MFLDDFLNVSLEYERSFWKVESLCGSNVCLGYRSEGAMLAEGLGEKGQLVWC